jgi:hypothetical protein
METSDEAGEVTAKSYELLLGAGGQISPDTSILLQQEDVLSVLTKKSELGH